MLSRFAAPLLRTLRPPLPSSMAARVLSRALSAAAVSILPVKLPPRPRCFQLTNSPLGSASILGWTGFNCHGDSSIACGFGGGNGVVPASRREYRKVRMKKVAAARKKESAEKELELSVQICIEEQLPEDSEIMDIAEMLRLNVPMAMKLAFEGLNNSRYKTRDMSISDVGCFESVELSVLLCNNEFIRKLNKEWRDEDHATDVLSMSQHIPELKLPILMLGDIVISVETAARQAEGRGHTLIDEIRILVVHGLLHLLGFDHELSDEAEEEMEKGEERLLKGLGWKGKGLIHGASDADADTDGRPHVDDSNDRKRVGSLRFYKPKFRYIFCDMDGTLLNNKSQISLPNAEALKEATSRGVKVVIATGKARGAVINLLKMVDLTGASEFTPGVFVQGLLVYGRQGREIFRRNLEPSICREALLYSREHKVPIVAFSEDRCLSLFEHPLVDSLHTIYHEQKAEIIPSVEEFVAGNEIQKLIFLDTAEGVDTTLRPYWEKATGNRASVVQAVSDMLEIVPPATSKGNGVRLLLQHLGVSPEEGQVPISAPYRRLVPTPPPSPRVFGCVIGVQSSRTVEIFNSFELVYEPSTNSLDRVFLEKKQEHYKKVFPNFYILGWYSTDSGAHESDMVIHKAFMDINESPVYVLLNPSINPAQKDLPITIFESELHVIDSIPQLTFATASYTIETVEAERISIDHVAHLKPSYGGSAAMQLSAHHTGMHSAIKMLNSRVRVLHHYLQAMQKGDIPSENSLLRQVSNLLRRLPAIESEKFQDDFLMEYNDTLLISYLAMFTNCSSTMNELVDKFNTVFDRHSRRGGRTSFM